MTDEQLPDGLLDHWLARVATMDRDILEDFIARERRSWPAELLVELELAVEARGRELSAGRRAD